MNLTGIKKRLKALQPDEGQLWHITTPEGENWYRAGKGKNRPITEEDKQRFRDHEAEGLVKIYKIKPMEDMYQRAEREAKEQDGSKKV